MFSTFFCVENGQRLSILDYDENWSSGRYKAVINNHQMTVLHLQTVDTKDTPDVSQLSLCPGVMEADVVTPSSSITKFLIEKADDEIVYRYAEFFFILTFLLSD